MNLCNQRQMSEHKEICCLEQCRSGEKGIRFLCLNHFLIELFLCQTLAWIKRFLQKKLEIHIHVEIRNNRTL